MLTRLLPLLIPTLAASVLVHPREAEACTFPPVLDVDEDLDAAITGVPTSGIVPIFVRAIPDQVMYLDVVVTDDSGATVPGTFELGDTRLVWRSVAPLAPSSSYLMTIGVDRLSEYNLAFTTAADATLPVLGFRTGDVHLGEIQRDDRRICCNAAVNSCGFDDYEHCWVQEATYLPQLEAVVEVEPEAARYYTFELDAPGASSSYSGVGSRYGSWLYAIYDATRAEYCVTVRALSLTGAGEATHEVCQSDAAREPLPVFEPEAPDASVCTGDAVDPDTGDIIDLDTGGCSAAGGGAAHSVWLALVGLVALRRRRRLHPVRR